MFYGDDFFEADLKKIIVINPMSQCLPTGGSLQCAKLWNV